MPPPTSDATAAATARQVIGDYIVKETIGKGSFGKVKRGIHSPTGQEVAIKILNRQKLKTANMDKKIRREIKILKLFRHPNVCRLYEVIQTSTDIFLIMEFVDGGELYDYIVKQGHLKEDAARYVFQQIVCALEYGHHYRVVHRDLKPENILLGSNLQVKMIDFGLANLMQDGEFLRTSCGSPNYAAPEVISGKLYYGPEVDVWSCGVILYALLCGCLPFDEETIPLLFAKIKRGKYYVPSHVSPGAKALLEQLLQVDPLVRVTIPQIRDHPWFRERLPPQLQYREDMSEMNYDRASPSIVQQISQVMGVYPIEVIQQFNRGEGRLFVAYQILFDLHRKNNTPPPAIGGGGGSQSLANLAQVPTSSMPSAATHMTASQKELNMGLVLSISPAVELLLDKGEAQTNKQLYNVCNYFPTSVQSDPKLLATPIVGSAGTFNIARSSGMGSPSLPGGSVGPSRSMLSSASSLRTANPTLSPVVGSVGRIGTVGRTEHMYTREEENMIVQNNYGWRIGIMTDHRSIDAVELLCDICRLENLEWKVVSPFRMLLRKVKDPQDADQTHHLVLSVNFFRIAELHSKGYVVDFSIIRGNAMTGLDMILSLTEKLLAQC